MPGIMVQKDSYDRDGPHIESSELVTCFQWPLMSSRKYEPWPLMSIRIMDETFER